jgi:hypothetical protein
MILVAIAAICVWAERMWRRRALDLEQVAQHASMEAHYSDLAGVPRQPPSTTVDALTPDGKAVEFVIHGPSPRVYYPLGTKNLADQATRTRLINMCRLEAAHDGAIRRMFERNPARPWLRFNPSLSSD